MESPSVAETAGLTIAKAIEAIEIEMEDKFDVDGRVFDQDKLSNFSSEAIPKLQKIRDEMADYFTGVMSQFQSDPKYALFVRKIAGMVGVKSWYELSQQTPESDQQFKSVMTLIDEIALQAIDGHGSLDNSQLDEGSQEWIEIAQMEQVLTVAELVLIHIRGRIDANKSFVTLECPSPNPGRAVISACFDFLAGFDNECVSDGFMTFLTASKAITASWRPLHGHVSKLKDIENVLSRNWDDTSIELWYTHQRFIWFAPSDDMVYLEHEYDLMDANRGSTIPRAAFEAVN